MELNHPAQIQLDTRVGELFFLHFADVWVFTQPGPKPEVGGATAAGTAFQTNGDSQHRRPAASDQIEV